MIIRFPTKEKSEGEMIHQSEVSAIKETIAAEYLAAQWGMTGLAQGTSKHSFITKRMENMGKCHEQLQTYFGDEAIGVVADLVKGLPEKPTRAHLRTIIPGLLGDTQETAHLCDWIEDMWETQDILVKRFGSETAKKIIDASS